MHYYSHHIGDFIKATSRLSDSQAMAYLRLTWLYYDKDGIVANDPEQIAFEIGSDLKTVILIIKTYFDIDGEFIKQSRCDKELQGYLNKSTGGKKGAESRWNNKDSDSLPIAYPSSSQCVPNANPMPTQCDPNANQEPRTKNQLKTNTNVVITTPPSLKTKDGIPDCPHQKILAAYKQSIPELPFPKDWSGLRASALKSRWVWVMKNGKLAEPTEDCGVEYFKRLFDYIAQSDFLMGRAGNFSATLDWICKNDNFLKIIEGKYENRKVAA